MDAVGSDLQVHAGLGASLVSPVELQGDRLVRKHPVTQRGHQRRPPHQDHGTRPATLDAVQWQVRQAPAPEVAHLRPPVGHGVGLDVGPDPDDAQLDLDLRPDAECRPVGVDRRRALADLDGPPAVCQRDRGCQARDTGAPDHCVWHPVLLPCSEKPRSGGTPTRPAIRDTGVAAGRLPRTPAGAPPAAARGRRKGCFRTYRRRLSPGFRVPRRVEVEDGTRRADL